MKNKKPDNGFRGTCCISLTFRRDGNNEDLLNELQRRAQQLKSYRGGNDIAIKDLMSPQERWEIIEKYFEDFSLEQAAEDEIKSLITPEILGQLEDHYRPADDLVRLVASLAGKAAKRAMAQHAAEQAHRIDNELKEKAIASAHHHWHKEPELTKSDVAEKIMYEFEAVKPPGASKLPTIETIMGWIAVEVPQHKKRGGRPRKRSD